MDHAARAGEPLRRGLERARHRAGHGRRRAQIESSSELHGRGHRHPGRLPPDRPHDRHGRHVVQPEPLPGRIDELLHERAGYQQPGRMLFRIRGAGVLHARILGHRRRPHLCAHQRAAEPAGLRGRGLRSDGAARLRGRQPHEQLRRFPGHDRAQGAPAAQDGARARQPAQLGRVLRSQAHGFLQRRQPRQNTRNDPDPASAAKDFVQYVYWGNTSDVNVPCRTTPSDRSSLYDDNRHNPGGSPASDWSLVSLRAWSTPRRSSARTAGRFTSLPTTATPTPLSEGSTPSTWTHRATP